jgi:hypothetical protein
MLDRMNAEVPIKDNADFSRALRQVFNAKNTMSRIKGYTPEQAVLGLLDGCPHRSFPAKVPLATFWPRLRDMKVTNFGKPLISDVQPERPL